MLLSCSKSPGTDSNSQEDNFLTAIPIKDMNQSLVLYVDSEQTRFRSGSEIRLITQNKSSKFIYFAEDTSITLLMLREDNWIEVKNEITHTGSITLSPEGTPLLDLRYTYIKPILEQDLANNSQKDLPLRIVMIGEIVKNDVRTGESVGAYVDVYVSP